MFEVVKNVGDVRNGTIYSEGIIFMFKKMLIVNIFFLCSQFCGLNALAQNELQVSGIVYGEDPVAMVDDIVVKIGDEIEGFKVEKIEPNSVTFRSKSGEIILKTIITASDTQETLNADKQKGRSERNSETNVRAAAFNNQDVEQAQTFVKQADQLLQRSVMSVAVYNQALTFYEKADTSLRYAFERNFNEDYRKKIKIVMSAVLDYKNGIRAKKNALEESIEKAKKDRRLVLGMTKSDVIEMWGRAKQVNSDNYSGNQSEQWVYGDPIVNATYVYFDDGIVTSVQSR